MKKTKNLEANPEAVKKLAGENYGILWKWAHKKHAQGKFSSIYPSAEDFVSELSIGFMKGIKTWLERPNQKTKLSTWVWHHLDWEFLRVINNRGLIKTPKYWKQEQIDKCKYTVFIDRAQNIRLVGNRHNLDRMIARQTTIQIVDPQIREEQINAIAADLLNSLSEKYRIILCLRWEGKTFQEIGNKFGITKERVRQIQNRGIEKMRQTAIERGYQERWEE